MHWQLSCPGIEESMSGVKNSFWKIEPWGLNRADTVIDLQNQSVSNSNVSLGVGACLNVNECKLRWMGGQKSGEMGKRKLWKTPRTHWQMHKKNPEISGFNMDQLMCQQTQLLGHSERNTNNRVHGTLGIRVKTEIQFLLPLKHVKQQFLKQKGDFWGKITNVWKERETDFSREILFHIRTDSENSFCRSFWRFNLKIGVEIWS